MPTWRQIGSIWQLKPADPRGQIDFIGGSYLAATPQVSYRRLLEDLAAKGLVVQAWSTCRGSTISPRPAAPGSIFATPGANLNSGMAPSRPRFG